MREKIDVVQVFEALLAIQVVVIVSGANGRANATTFVAQKESVAFGGGEVDDIVDELVFRVEVGKSVIKRRQVGERVVSSSRIGIDGRAVRESGGIERRNVYSIEVEFLVVVFIGVAQGRQRREVWGSGTGSGGGSS